MKIEFLCTRHPLSGVSNGGVSLTRANYMALQKYGDVSVTSTLSDHEWIFSRMKRKLQFVFGRFAGFSKRRRVEVINKIQKSKTDLLFIDHSQLASVLDLVKNRNDNLKTLLHYHNFESEYYKSYKYRFMVRNAIDKLRYNDIKYSRIADAIIVLTESDLKKIIDNNACTRSWVLPISSFKGKAIRSTSVADIERDYFLFFGTNMPHNRETINFLQEHIVDYIKHDILIAGSGMQKLKKKYKNNKLRFIGYQENYEELFQRAIAMISPVFSGSGMNMKHVDSLRCGTNLVTNEFGVRGFPRDFPQGIHICENKEAFITILNGCAVGKDNSQELQNYFDKYFSYKRREEKFGEILTQLKLMKY